MQVFLAVSQDSLIYRVLNKVLRLLHFPRLYYLMTIRKLTDFIMLGDRYLLNPESEKKIK